MARIFVKTFGCSHNISDSEFMEGNDYIYYYRKIGQLVAYGYKVVDSL